MGGLVQSGTLSGSISACASLNGIVSAREALAGTISLPAIIDYGGEVYEGEYIITPETASQRLPTAHKRMQDDLTVLAIPYYETTNETGGNTVYIGMEVEIYG